MNLHSGTQRKGNITVGFWGDWRKKNTIAEQGGKKGEYCMGFILKSACFFLFLALVLQPAISAADDCGCGGGGTTGDSSDISSGGYGSSEDPMIHLVRAREFLSRGDLPMAMAECRESLTLDPHNVQALLLEGEILFRMGRYGEAAEAFRKVTGMYPSEEEAYTRLGNTYLLLGDYRSAEKAYTRSLAIRPNDPVVRENLEKAVRLSGQENPSPGNEIFENCTVTGTAPRTRAESPEPAELTTPREEKAVPLSSRTPTTDLSPVPFLIALVVTAFITRSEKKDQRLFSP